MRRFHDKIRRNCHLTGLIDLGFDLLRVRTLTPVEQFVCLFHFEVHLDNSLSRKLAGIPGFETEVVDAGIQQLPFLHLSRSAGCPQEYGPVNAASLSSESRKYFPTFVGAGSGHFDSARVNSVRFESL